jgi:hypothetical protein
MVELGWCISSVCVVLLLSSRFTPIALVWFSNFLKYLVFHFLFHWALCSFVDFHGCRGFHFISFYLASIFATTVTLGQVTTYDTSCCLCSMVCSEWIGESWIESAGGFLCLNWRLFPHS